MRNAIFFLALVFLGGCTLPRAGPQSELPVRTQVRNGSYVWIYGATQEVLTINCGGQVPDIVCAAAYFVKAIGFMKEDGMVVEFNTSVEPEVAGLDTLLNEVTIKYGIDQSRSGNKTRYVFELYLSKSSKGYDGEWLISADEITLQGGKIGVEELALFPQEIERLHFYTNSRKDAALVFKTSGSNNSTASVGR